MERTVSTFDTTRLVRRILTSIMHTTTRTTMTYWHMHWWGILLTLVLCFVAIRQYAYRKSRPHEYGVSWDEILGLIRTTALAFCPTRLTWPNDLHALFSILISRLFPALHMHSTTLFGVSWLSACTSPERWTITRQPTPWMLITTSYSVFTTS